MAELVLDDMVATMTNAVKTQVSQDWTRMAGFAAEQMKLIGLTIIAINTLQKAGEITPEQAKADLEIAKNTAEMALITETSLTKLMAQQAIANALDAVKDVVDEVLDFPLL